MVGLCSGCRAMGLPAASPASQNDAFMSTIVSPFAKSARTVAQRRATASGSERPAPQGWQLHAEGSGDRS